MKNRKIQFHDLGILDYKKAYDIQVELLNQDVERKQKGLETQNTVLLLEHPHVYTLGRHGDRKNLKISDGKLKEIDAIFITTDRGGDITYHGYGQLVVYPILDLDNWQILSRRYVFALEEIVIRMLTDYGVYAHRLDNAPGVWLTDRPRPEKICAIGVRIIHNITMHGMALNVNTDLSYFDYINPCGFTDKGVTSMQKELAEEISMQEVKEKQKKYFIQVFEEI